MKMIRKFAICAIAVGLLACLPARADESSVRQAFQSKLPNVPVLSVTRTPMQGLYEVVSSGRIFYVDENANFVLRGELFDLRSGNPRSLTEERAQHVAAQTAQLTAQTLPQSQNLAIKRVKGNGKRLLYTFEDPNCGYCKKLQHELTRLNNVTIYTFLIPILGPDSIEKSKAIWCAKDRAQAWENAMIKGSVPAGKRDCDTPFDKTEQLRQRFAIQGTPAIYNANGHQIGGYVTADQIEAQLVSSR